MTVNMDVSRHIQFNDILLAHGLARTAECAAEAVHCVIRATNDTTQINEAISSGARTRMWTVLQEFLERYKFLIVATEPITHITLVHLTSDQVAALSTDDLVVQLQIVKGFVFAHHALRSTNRLAFRECFRKLTKSLPTLPHSMRLRNGL